MRADAQTRINKAFAIPLAKQFLRLGLHLFFFAADERDHVPLNVHGSYARITCADRGLKRHDKNLLETESICERLENENESCGGAVWIGDNESGFVSAIFLLERNRIKVRDVHLGNQQRHIRIHPVISRIADDRIPGARKIFFSPARNRRIECGKNEVALQRRAQTPDHQVARNSGNRRVEMPAHCFSLGLPGRTFRGCDFGEFKPRMIREQAHDTLTDQASRAEHADAKLLLQSRRLPAHTTSSCCAGPMRVPRKWGLNVLRTQTVISASSASGSTWGCRTFAPLNASACASS